MSNDDTDRTESGEGRSEAAKRARQAFDAARDVVAGTDLDELRTKAADAAASLVREGRDLLSNNPDLARATNELRESIRRNPFAAIGIAFTAGLVLALITRG